MSNNTLSLKFWFGSKNLRSRNGTETHVFHSTNRTQLTRPTITFEATTTFCAPNRYSTRLMSGNISQQTYVCLRRQKLSHANVDDEFCTQLDERIEREYDWRGNITSNAGKCGDSTQKREIDPPFEWNPELSGKISISLIFSFRRNEGDLKNESSLNIICEKIEWMFAVFILTRRLWHISKECSEFASKAIFFGTKIITKFILRIHFLWDNNRIECKTEKERKWKGRKTNV